MRIGIQRYEGKPIPLIESTKYREPIGRVALFYGFAERLRDIFEDYRSSGRKALYIDLGYWNRKKKTRFDGFHKISINDRHPTAYFQRRAHNPDRLGIHHVPILPWRKQGDHILVVGMSGKGALAEGFRPQQWERDTIARLRGLTKRPIIYRPKPSWLGSRPIAGSIYQKITPIEPALENCHAVVCHHSNVAVDAILAGIPAFCEIGVASVMGNTDLANIETPLMIDGREQWAADIAYSQWSIDEMKSGACWRYFRSEGLV